MRVRWLTILDPLAAAGAAGTAAVLVLYVGIVRSQGEDPAPWVVAVLGAALALAVYAVPHSGRRRRPALLLAAALLGALGLLAILSIGIGILVAAFMCLLAALRSDPRRPDPVGPAR